MKKRQTVPQANELRRPSGADPASNPPADSTLSDPLLEEYIDRLCEPISKKMPTLMAGELRRELRAHLLERIDAHQELGSSYQEAVKYTLGQFGEGQDFAAEWAQEWKPTLRNVRLRSWQGDILIMALLLFWATVADILLGVIEIPIQNYLRNSGNGLSQESFAGKCCFTFFLVSAYILIPAGCGALIGYRVRYRPILSMLAFLTFLCLTALVCCDTNTAINFIVTVLLGTPSLLIGIALGLRLRNKRRTLKQENFTPLAPA